MLLQYFISFFVFLFFILVMLQATAADGCICLRLIPSTEMIIIPRKANVSAVYIMALLKTQTLSLDKFKRVSLNSKDDVTS